MIAAALSVATATSATSFTGGASDARAANAAHPPVVMIVLDELPSVALTNGGGGISHKRFPNFARLAREAVWYPNHTTVASVTYRSVPAMLSGSWNGDPNALPIARDYPRNLFTELAASGYRVNALESTTQLCPRSICRLLAGGWVDPAKYSGSVLEFQKAKYGLTADLTRYRPGRAMRMLRIAPGEFNFLHLMLPHHPYLFLPSGQTYPDRAHLAEIYDPGTFVVTGSRGRIGLSYQRMMLQIGYVDRLIGQLRREAKRRRQWDSMMLVVVGDHGWEQRAGMLIRDVGADALGSTAFTPLFIKYPGQTRGGTSPLATQGVDVFPTVAKAIGAEPPETDGVAIQEIPLEPRDVTVDGNSPVPFRQARTSRDFALAYQSRLLGGRSLFRLGPASQLIGRRVAKRARGGAKVDRPSRFRRVSRGAASVPSLITGRAPSLRVGATVAVTVNGVVRGTGQIFADRGRRFGVVVDPRFFAKRNEIGVYRVRGKRIGSRLR